MKRLRIGYFLAPNTMALFEHVAGEIGRGLGVPTQFVVGSDYGQVSSGEFDAAFVCGLPYVLASREEPSPVVPVAAPVPAGFRYGGRPRYFSDVIVRRGSPFRSFADLKGARWAYNEPFSHSGYGLTRCALVAMGETSGFFGDVVCAGYHEDAIRMVRAGAVDASAIDSLVLEIEVTRDPSLRDAIEVIEVLGPSAIQPLVVSASMHPSLIARVRDIVVGLHLASEAPGVLRDHLIERFVPIEDRDYDDVRAMLSDSERAGFIALR